LGKEEDLAIIMRLIQQYDPRHKAEFHALEKQFAELEHRGLLPRGQRSIPISGKEPANTIVWECRFESMSAVEKALKQIEDSPEHTELGKRQHPMFQQSWTEFYEILDY
jgi:hypothetical protein